MKKNESIELKLLDKRLEKLQKELFDLEKEAIPDAKALVESLEAVLVRKSKQFDDTKGEKIRLQAELEEKGE